MEARRTLKLLRQKFVPTAERTKMTEAISKEELLRLKEAMPDGQSKLFIHLLIKKCKELDSWLPIDENTPKDKSILLLWPELGAIEGYWICDSWYCDMWELTGSLISRQPTHYKLLPEDPK